MTVDDERRTRWPQIHGILACVLVLALYGALFTIVACDAEDELTYRESIRGPYWYDSYIKAACRSTRTWQFWRTPDVDIPWPRVQIDWGPLPTCELTESAQLRVDFRQLSRRRACRLFVDEGLKARIIANATIDLSHGEFALADMCALRFLRLSIRRWLRCIDQQKQEMLRALDCRLLPSPDPPSLLLTAHNHSADDTTDTCPLIAPHTFQ